MATQKPLYYDEAGRPVYPEATDPQANVAAPYQTIGQAAREQYREGSPGDRARQILLDPAGLFQPPKVQQQFLGGSPQAFAAQLQENQRLGLGYRAAAADAGGAAANSTATYDTAKGMLSGGYSAATRTGEDARLLTAGGAGLVGRGEGLSADAARVRAGGVAGQDAAIGGMLRAAQVRTPSLAEAQARAGVQQVQQQALSQAAGASNQALATRNAVLAGSGAAAQVANQQAALRAQEEALRQQRVVQAYEAVGQQLGQRVGVGFGAQAQGLGAQAQGLGAQAQGLGAQLGAAGTQTQAGASYGNVAGNIGQLGLGREQLYTGAARDQQQLLLDSERAQLEADTKAEGARLAGMGEARGRAGGILGMVGKFFGGG